MNSERTRISRRDFLKYPASAAALALTPEAALRLYTKFIESERLSRPQPTLLTTIPQFSVAYGSSVDQNNSQHLVELGRRFGKKPQIANFFISSIKYRYQYLPIVEQMHQAAALGYLPMVSWGMEGDVFTTFEKSWAYLEIFGDDLKTIKGPILSRQMYEVNGEWTHQWYGKLSPDQFHLGWKRIHDVLTNSGIDIKFVFSPNVTTIANPFEPFYPGDNYVDFVSLDVYNKHSLNPLNPRHWTFLYLSPEAELGCDIEALNRIAPTKPFILTEVNCSLEDEDQRATWIAGAIDYSIRAGALGWLTFDWNKKGMAWDEDNWDIRLYPKVMTRVNGILEEKHHIANMPNPPRTAQEILNKISTNSFGL